jgi:bacteriorhodopsin
MTTFRLCRINWRPLVVMGLLTSVLLGSMSCTSGPADQEYLSNPVIISYVAAASWLRGLDQMRCNGLQASP